MNKSSRNSGLARWSTTPVVEGESKASPKKTWNLSLLVGKLSSTTKPPAKNKNSNDKIPPRAHKNDRLSRILDENNRLHAHLTTMKEKLQRLCERHRLVSFLYRPTTSDELDYIPTVDHRAVEDYDKDKTLRQLGGYRLGHELGAGCYASVFGANCIATGRSYALKLFDKSKFANMVELRQLDTEVRVLATMPHVNLIGLEQIVHSTHYIGLVTERASTTVHALYGNDELNDHSVRGILLGLLRAVEHLHAHDCAHLDIKPENLLVVDYDELCAVHPSQVRLCDFGFCHIGNRMPLDPMAEAGRSFVIGTPGFYAPEMVLAQPSDSQTLTLPFDACAADMWSVGAVLLELTQGFSKKWLYAYGCTGQTLVDNLFSCLNRLLIEDVDLHHLLTEQLLVDPGRRISAKQALQHPWIVANSNK